MPLSARLFALVCASLAAARAATPIDDLAKRMTEEGRRKVAAAGTPVDRLDPKGRELAQVFLRPLAPKVAAPNSARLQTQAAELMRDRVSLLRGYDVQDLAFPYDWFRAPKEDWQWPTHLSRHYYLQPLAGLYAATGEQQYAAKMVAVLTEWTRSFPLGRPGLPWRWKSPPDSGGQPSGEAGFPNYADGPWTSLSAHARIDTWLSLLPLIAGSDALDNQTTALLLNSLLGDHRQVMLDFPRSGTANQFLSIGASLVKLALALPDFTGQEDARRVGTERIVEFATRQVYEDGSVAECSPNYGIGSVGRLQSLAAELKARGIALPAVVEERVRKAVRYYALTSDPRGRSPRIAKGGGEILKGIGELNRSIDDPEVAWIVSQGKQGAEPKALDYGFPWAGHFVFRSGWKPDDVWLFFEAGPRGSGHHDLAQLGVQLIAGGTPLLVDPGYYTYSNSGEEGAMYRYLNSTLAHNTAAVDGQSQVSVPPGVARGPNPKAAEYGWRTSAEASSAEGAYTYGYGDKGRIKVVHHRRVSMAKASREFTVEDRFTGEGGHRYEILWQAPPKATVEVNGKRALIRAGQASVTLEFESSAELQVAAAPGWYSETYGDLQPSTTIKVTATGSGPSVRTRIRPSAK